MKTIFDQTILNNLILKNRIFRSATWEDMADKDGHVTDELIDVYRELAYGGVGTIITGMTTISPDDVSLSGLMKFYDDMYIEQNKRLTDAVHEYNCNIVMQVAILDYCKRDVYGMLTRVSINQLTNKDIKEAIQLFKDAALRAKKAGYDGIQIHAAHNWFLSKFISPLNNQRTDEYGGNSEKRAKILIDVLHAIREVVGKEFFITIKINCEDFMEGGLTIEDSLIACKLLSDNGIDAIEISGNYTSRSGIRTKDQEGYFKEFAILLKKLVNTPVILVGGHRSIENMNEILNYTDIEYLSLSRPLIREPELINRWKSGDIRPSICISCNSCYNTKDHKCIFNIK